MKSGFTEHLIGGALSSSVVTIMASTFYQQESSSPIIPAMLGITSLIGSMLPDLDIRGGNKLLKFNLAIAVLSLVIVYFTNIYHISIYLFLIIIILSTKIISVLRLTGHRQITHNYGFFITVPMMLSTLDQLHAASLLFGLFVHYAIDMMGKRDMVKTMFFKHYPFQLIVLFLISLMSAIISNQETFK